MLPFGAGSDPSNIVDSGYFMLGTVVSADMDLIGQMQPHTPTRFVMVDMEQALAARAERAARLRQVREALRAS